MKNFNSYFLKAALLGTVFSTNLVLSSDAHAGSVLIEKNDGSFVAEEVPADACPLYILTVQPASTRLPDISYFALPRQGVVLKHVTGLWFELTDSDGTVARGLLRGEQYGNEKLQQRSGYEGWIKNNPADAPALLRIYPDPKKPCTAYLASPSSRFFGVQHDTIQTVKFFDDNNGAATVIQELRARQAEAMRKFESQATVWRKKVVRGIDTHCGMVIDIKPPLIQVQTAIGEKWFKLEQLYPANTRGCRFINGAYQN